MPTVFLMLVVYGVKCFKQLRGVISYCSDKAVHNHAETKGGKSFYKVGFVSINLACFAAVGNVINRRRYILEGYDGKRKRQDNSLLSISFCLRQLTGDNCFRT
ncbi:unnamed protein product [Trichobilharzia regenti]|nr:unnamed protein product [Trichobilharzia regenti]